MKKLMMVVVGFGLVSASVASASVERTNGLAMALGEKKAGEMNGRMLACGRTSSMVKLSRVSGDRRQAQPGTNDVSSARSAR